LLTPYGDGPLTDERAAAVRRYRDLIPAARAAVAKRGFTGAVLERQYKLIDESSAFLDGVLERKESRTADVAAFARRMGPLVMENAAEAARAQIDGLHAGVMAWRKDMTADEWRRLRVVVMGSHMPRDGNLAMQYFTRVLDEPVDDRRLMYAESVWDEEPALKLVGTSVLDTRVGADFGDERHAPRSAGRCGEGVRSSHDPAGPVERILVAKARTACHTCAAIPRVCRDSSARPSGAGAARTRILCPRRRSKPMTQLYRTRWPDAFCHLRTALSARRGPLRPGHGRPRPTPWPSCTPATSPRPRRRRRRSPVTCWSTRPGCAASPLPGGRRPAACNRTTRPRCCRRPS
jgi:hypothetical protein